MSETCRERFIMPCYGVAAEELVTQHKTESQKLQDMISAGRGSLEILAQSAIIDRLGDEIMRVNLAGKDESF